MRWVHETKYGPVEEPVEPAALRSTDEEILMTLSALEDRLELLVAKRRLVTAMLCLVSVSLAIQCAWLVIWFVF